MSWSPKKEPYRVIKYYPVNNRMKWGNSSQVFETLEAAHTQALKWALKKINTDVKIDKAENPDTWQINGKWKIIRTYKNKGKLTDQTRQELIELSSTHELG